MQKATLPVYVPADGTLSTILPKSGIVGSPAHEWFDSSERNDLHRVVVDYEGNRFNAANIVTFADRVRHAAGRHTEHYPTVARAVVTEDEVVRVATFDAEADLVVVENLAALTAWLDLWPSQLPEQLVCTGVFA
jgi:hypothetical protein